MDTVTDAAIVAVCLLCLLSAFFSACETAFMSCNRIKLKSLVAQGKKSAARTLSLLDDTDRLISTVLIGNNIANIAASSIVTVIFVRLFGENAGVGAALVVTTIVILLVGEITPKTLVREAPESFAIIATPLLKIFTFVFKPLNFLAVRWKLLVMKPFRIRGDRSITEAELLTFVEEALHEGGINEREEVMIKRTIHFDELSAHDVCTPRVDIVAVSASDTALTIAETFRRTRFSRLPVYKDSIDNITGIILHKDFQYEVIGAGLAPEKVIKPVIYVPQSVKAPRVLRILQEQQSHLAVVIDEFGGTMGIVTVEDIVEELVGEIWDEHDEVVRNISRPEGGPVTIQGRTQLAELCAFFGLESPSEHTTLASWVLEQSGGELHVGAVFDCQGIPLSVSKIKHGTVAELTASPPA